MKELKPEIGVLNHVHTDQRRSIIEFNGSDFAVTQFKVTAVIPLGDHYHEKKSETFIILKGGGTFLSNPVNERGELIGTTEKVTLTTGSVVFVPAFLAHTFLLEEGTEMICYSSAPFNENDKDLLPCKLSI